MLLLVLKYVVLAFLVVFLSIKLSMYIDILDKKTNLSGAFIGGVLLAAVTSLPELFTSITSVLIVNQPDLVQGNVFGSNVFNLTIIGGCILFASKSFKDAELSKSHLGTSICSIAMFIVCLIGMYAPYTIPFLPISLNWTSVLIIILYIINIKKMQGDSSQSNKEECDVDLTIKQITIRFAFLAVALVVASILLTTVTDKLASALNLGTTVAGAIFLGVATSLPELTSSVNLIRLKNFNASYGNVIGSNLFNFTILCFGDILYVNGNIYGLQQQSVNLILFGIISSLLTTATLFTKKSQKLSMLFGFLIIMSYVVSIGISI